MEQFKKLSAEEVSTLSMNPFAKIGKDWALITAGTEDNFNTMTVSWGFMGVMWSKNTFTTVIRPQRYTKEFVDANDYFTVCFFPPEQHDALAFCGSHSGRDCDKVKETGLTPFVIKDSFDAYGQTYPCDTTGFAEASMILVCKKAYAQEMTPESFIAKENEERWYPDKDYHIQYIGEIVAAYVKQ